MKKPSMPNLWGRAVHGLLALDGMILACYLVFCYCLTQLITPSNFWLLGLVVAYGARAGLNEWRMALLDKAVTRAEHDVFLRIMARGDLGANMLMQAPKSLANYLRFLAQKNAVAWLIVPLVLLFLAHKAIAVVVAMNLPVMVILMIIIGIKTAKKSRDELGAMNALSARFMDWFWGANTLYRTRADDFAINDISKSSDEYRVRIMRVLRLAFGNNLALEVVAMLALAGSAIYLASTNDFSQTRAAQNSLWILLLIPEIYAPFRRLAASYHAKGAAQSAYALLGHYQTNTANDKNGDKAILPTDVQIIHAKHPSDAPNIDINIAITHGNRVRLAPLCVKVVGGARVAVLGKSGAGKSSLLLAIAGLINYDGHISMHQDGKPWRGNIGYLGQTPPILAMSVRDNLQNAGDFTDKMMISALSDVGLWESLAQKNGLDTPLQHQGRGLSGGEVARLAIAQLLLFDAPIWLLDEPFGALDKASRDEILALLLRVSVGKTVLMAQHDASSFEDGQIWLSHD